MFTWWAVHSPIEVIKAHSTRFVVEVYGIAKFEETKVNSLNFQNK